MRTNFLLFTLAVVTLVPLHAWSAPPPCAPCCSPLLIDVNGDGIKLGPRGTGVHFDLRADGIPIHMQWVRARGDEAFLVADLNGNGILDDGSELFGQGTTVVLTGEKADNGFIALAQYDLPALGGNDDGRITRDDAIWPLLRLWTDRNADGRARPSEMTTPRALNLLAFGTIPKFRNHVDESGNAIPFYAWVDRSKGKKLLMVDVFFAKLP
jgi:hypothetical protein